jgi:predicted GNAT family acetyltransferase
MGAASKIVQAAIELLSKKGGGALPDTTLDSVSPKTLPTDEASRMAVNKSEKDASDIFGAGATRVIYKDQATGGYIEVVKRPDGPSSVIDLQVPEQHRRRGVGAALQKAALDDNPKLMGQVSSKSAARSAFNQGRRPYDDPNATIDDVLRSIDENSSVNMTNLNLPTDEASRMARAQEMGYTIEAYKGTYPYDASTGPVYGFKDGKWQQVDRIGAEPDVIKSFNSKNTTEQGGKFAGFFGNVDVANRFAKAGGAQGAVFPTLLKMDSPLVIDAGGKPAGAFQFSRMAEDAGTMKDYQAFNDAFAPGSKFDGVILKNTLDEGTVYVPSASNQVRGRFAQFDPAKAGSADILAGFGVVGAGAALSQQDGFDYGALSNVVEENNGQSSN